MSQACVGSWGPRVESLKLWPAGIVAVHVSLLVGEAEVTFDPDIISATDVAKLLEGMGFSATLMEHAAKTHGKLDLRVRTESVC